MSHAIAPAPASATASSRVYAEQPSDSDGVDALVQDAFGSGRFAKTAERLREGSQPAAGFVVREGGRIIGAVRLWPISIGDRPALFLGPIAVTTSSRSDGLGAELVQACLDHAARSGVSGVLLVGDLAYFQRFNFTPAPDAILPGPVDRRRVLWLGATDEAPAGPVRIAC